MNTSKISRRTYMAMLSAAAAPTIGYARTAAGTVADRERRMKWWHEAKFGMFIHWGLYSVRGRHEWVMENEGIPVSEYQKLADRFTPKPNAARDWAKLAKRAGQKYMVMTTKHHEASACSIPSTPITALRSRRAGATWSKSTWKRPGPKGSAWVSTTP